MKQQHEQAADMVADFCMETGAHVRREAFVAEITSDAVESWLDIWAFGTMEVSDLLIDITVRHPAESRYQPGAADSPGHAASKAAEEKYTRYPASGGRTVTPFVLETWGRLGESAEDLLTNLAAAASRQDLLRGRVSVGRL